MVLNDDLSCSSKERLKKKNILKLIDDSEGYKRGQLMSEE